MAQPQLLHLQSSVDGLDIPGQPLPQQQPYFQYNQQVFTSSEQFSSLNHAMVESILRGQCSSDSYMQLQPWVPQESPSQDNKSSVTARNISSSNSLIYPPGQGWREASSLTGTFDWQRAMREVEPYIVPETDDRFRQTHELVYNPIAAQNTVVKGIGAFGAQVSWAPSGLNGLPRGASANGSDLDTNNSSSPQSYASDDPETSYTPGPLSDYASPVVNFHGYPRGSPSHTGLSSQFGSYPVQKIDDPTSAHMGSSMGMAVVPSTSFRRQGDATARVEDTQHSGSEYAYSQGSSPGASPWYDPHYSHDLNGLPFRPRDTQVCHPHSASDTSLSSANDDRRSQYRSAPWTGPRASVPTQSRMQDRFQVPRNTDTQAQRQQNDQLLIEGKRQGMTYRAIKEKMVGEQPAESTLRGRYRSLTKARKDRVRKPVWTKKDVDLLNEIVEREFDRIETNLQNPQSLSFDQKLVKVPWKKVAEFIAEGGGTYHFGNSTCKRKWLEMNSRHK